MNSKNSLIFVILLVITIASLYANSLGYPFLLDDNVLVKDNPLIRNMSNIPIFFKMDIFSHGLDKKPISSSYRPIQTLTYAIDLLLWGSGPKGFHLGNVLIHIINAILVFFIIRKLFNSLFLSYFTSFLFAIHPVNTQCVTYISGRADILVATFMLLSFLFYINYRKTNSTPFILSSIALYLFAVYTKESAIFNLPLILFIYNMSFDRKNLFRTNTYIFYILPLAIYFPMRLLALKGAVVQNLELAQLSLLPRLMTSLKTLFIDFRILLLPYDLHFGRTTKVEYSVFTSLSSIFTILAILFIIFMLRHHYKKWDREKAVKSGAGFFGISWFFVSMAPYLNIVPLQVFHSDSWLYFSSIGIYLTIAAIIEYMWQVLVKPSRLFRIALCILVSLALSYYGYTTVKRNGDYQDEIKFYLSNLRWRPNVKLYRAVGALYGEKKDYDNAIKYLKKAIEINKIYPSQKELEMAYYNLGITYLRVSDYEKAQKAFEKLLISDNEDLRNEAEKCLLYVKEHRDIDIK